MSIWARIQAGYRRMGLARRSALVSVGLLFAIQLAVQVFIRDRIENSVQLNLKSELESSSNVWGRLLDQNAQKLGLGAGVLAADFGFRSAVSSGDQETITSALQNSQDRIGATIAAFFDTQFELKNITDGATDPQLLRSLQQFAQSMTRSATKSLSIPVNGHLHQFVITPIKAPSTIGWIVMGFPVDQALATDMASITQTRVLMVQKTSNTPTSDTPTGNLLFSSLPVPVALEKLDLRADAGRVEIGGADYAYKRITDRADIQSVEVYLLSPMDAERAVFSYMKTVLVLIDGLGLLLFALGSIELARRVSQPLTALLEDARRLSQGDYSKAIPDFGRADEVGKFARAFDQMRESIQASEAQVRRLAYWDRLTGLPNRAQFTEKLTDRLHTPQAAAPLVVIVLDLDRFKHINDVLGYAFGDRILQIIAERLTTLMRDTDAVLSRLAGGNFAILLPHGALDDALATAKNINAVLDDPVRLDGQAVDLRVGIGICCHDATGPAVDADVLIGRAEVAMYAAKRSSAGLKVYAPAMDSGSALTLSMLGELRQAIANQELRLFLQPKIQLNSHAVIAAEALVRWQHPVRGMVPPMEFIPFAEQTGFIRHLTMWMIEAVAQAWPRLQPAEGQLRIAINLSTRDLLDQEFPAKLEALLNQYAIPRSGLCLEITESSIMDDPVRAEATLNELAQAGYKLSIDDFGTGYSSLAYLKRLPVHELKIDKSFVMGMEESRSDAQIVKSTIDLAHNLGLSVVAEGIENQAVYTLLNELTCDEAQGYFMSKPLPVDDFLAWRPRWEAKRAALPAA